MTASQIDKLGKRLRKADRPSREDLVSLQAVIADHVPALTEAVESLRGLGLQVASRPKTHGTLIDKLKREKSRLSSIHDIAGVRIVEELTVDEQDALVQRIVAAFPGAEIVDRRLKPSHGYRAVHVIVQVQDCYVEIQVRTVLQDLWAQVMETIGDALGRGVRYGQPPPGAEQTVAGLISVSEQIAGVEDQRAELAKLESELEEPSGDADPDEIEGFESRLREIEELKAAAAKAEHRFREGLKLVLRFLEWVRKGQARS